MSDEPRVIGIGGIFFKAKDPAALQSWYEEHLGIQADEDGTVRFWVRRDDNPNERALAVWSPFPETTRYFEPSKKDYMFNYRVDDLDAMLDKLRREGVQVDERVEEYEYGRFGWAMDPEGNRIELWEPPALEGR